METQTALLFKCDNGDTIRIRRPNALDIFQSNAVADLGNGSFKETAYYYNLLTACWDRGSDLKYLKNLGHEEGIVFHNRMRKFFDNKITAEDLKKFNGQSIIVDSQKEN